MLAISVSITVFIICAHYKGEYGYRVPVIVRKVVLEWMATIMRMKTVSNITKDAENVSLLHHKIVYRWFTKYIRKGLFEGQRPALP